MKAFLSKKTILIALILLSVLLVCGLFSGVDSGAGGGSVTDPGGEEIVIPPSLTCKHPAESLQLSYVSLNDDSHVAKAKCGACGESVVGENTTKHKYMKNTVTDASGISKVTSVCSLCSWTCSHKGEMSVTFGNPDDNGHISYLVCAACNVLVSEDRVEHNGAPISEYGTQLNNTYHTIRYKCDDCSHVWDASVVHSFTDGICRACGMTCTDHNWSTVPVDGYYVCAVCGSKKCAHTSSSPSTYARENAEQHTVYYSCDNCGVSMGSSLESHNGVFVTAYGAGVDDTHHQATFSCACGHTWTELQHHTYSLGICDECMWLCSHSSGSTGDPETGYYCYICNKKTG